jgi:hypothetical protein
MRSIGNRSIGLAVVAASMSHHPADLVHTQRALAQQPQLRNTMEFHGFREGSDDVIDAEILDEEEEAFPPVPKKFGDWRDFTMFNRARLDYHDRTQRFQSGRAHRGRR